MSCDLEYIQRSTCSRDLNISTSLEIPFITENHLAHLQQD